MFKIARNPTFVHTVPVLVPVDGGHETQSLKCRFRALTVAEFSQHDLNTPEGSETFLRAACVGFEDVVDDNGDAVPMSDALKDALLGAAYVRTALTRTYFEAMTKARVGN